MALPAIAPYAMPGLADLPSNKVSWTPDPKRAALLIHDMQNYFVGAFTADQSPVPELLGNIQRLRQQCKVLGIPVVYSAQPGGQTPQERGLQLDLWGPGVSGGPVQKQIVDALAPSEGDLFLTKWRYSAFVKTGLLELLHERGRDQLIICGIYAHIGCLQTATHAFMNDVQAFLVADALGDFSLEQHRLALQYAARLCAVTATTQQILEQLGTSRPGPALSRQQLREDVAEVLQGAPELGDEENLLERGLDSIRLMSLVERWRQRGAELSFVDLAEQPTLSAWYARLTSSPSSSAVAVS